MRPTTTRSRRYRTESIATAIFLTFWAISATLGLGLVAAIIYAIVAFARSL